MRQVLSLLIGAHVGLGITSLATMDLDLWEPLRAVRDAVIDSYEFIGGGNFFIGLAIATAVLIGLRFYAWDYILGAIADM